MKRTAIAFQTLIYLLSITGTFAQHDDHDTMLLNNISSSGSGSRSFTQSENSKSTNMSSQSSTAEAANASVDIDGKITNKSKVTLQSSGNELQLLPSYFSQMFDWIGNQNLKINLIHQGTGKDARTGEIIRRSILQITDQNGVTSFVGAVEYPLRESNELVPRFMQSTNLEEITSFVGVDSASVSSSESSREFDGFERGQVSGSMCSKCGLRTEVLSEDEQVHQYSIKISVLKLRLQQVLEEIKRASGQARLDALADLKAIKAQLSELEQLKVEREIEIEREKEEANKKIENAMRKRIETEIWERVAAMEKLKTDEWRVKVQQAEGNLGQLESAWVAERQKRKQQEDRFNAVSGQISTLEAKLIAIREKVLDLEKDGEEARGLIVTLNKSIRGEGAKKDELEKENARLVSTIEALKEKVKGENGSYASQVEERETLIKQIEGLRQKIKTVIIEKSKIQDLIADIKLKIAKDQETLSNEQTAKSKTLSELEMLKKSLMEKQSTGDVSLMEDDEHDQKVKDLMAQIRKLKLAIRRSKRRNKSSKSNVVMLQKTILKLKNAKKSQISVQRKLKNQIRNLRRKFCKKTERKPFTKDIFDEDDSKMHIRSSLSRIGDLSEQSNTKAIGSKPVTIDVDLDMDGHTGASGSKYTVASEVLGDFGDLEDEGVFLSGSHQQSRLDEIAALNGKSGRIGSFLIGSSKPKKMKESDSHKLDDLGNLGLDQLSGLQKKDGVKAKDIYKDKTFGKFFN